MKWMMPDPAGARCDIDHKQAKKVLLSLRTDVGKKEGPVKPAQVLREGRKSSDGMNDAKFRVFAM